MADRIKGITIEIGGNTVKLQESLSAVNKDLKQTQTALRDVERLLKFDPSSTQLLQQKQDLLKTAIIDTRSKLEQEKAAYDELVKAGVTTENQKEQQALAREIAETENKLKSLEKSYKDFGSVASQKIKSVGESIKDMGTQISTVGSSLTKNLTVPLAALGAASLKAFSEVDEGADIIVQKTGASGEALESMQSIMNDIAKSVPADFDQIGSSIGEVNTRFGLTGDALQSLSTQFIQFAKLNNVDVTNSVDLVQKALAAFGLSADDAGKLLDVLNKTSQNTGADVGTMSEGLIQNAAAFQEMGLSIDQATVMMGQLETSGANSETVMNGLRKALKNAAKDGVPLNKALADLQDKILSGTDSMDGLTAAYDVFGRSGDQIYQAVKEGTINFKELATEATDAADSVSSTFEATVDPIDQWKLTLNELKIAGAQLGNSLGTVLRPMLSKVAEIVGKAADAFDQLDDGTKENIVKFGLLAAACGPVLSVVGKLTTGVGSLVTGFGKLVGVVSSAASGFAGTSSGLAGVAAACGPAVLQFGALGAAIGTVIWGMTKTDSLTKEQIEAVGGLTDAERELIEQLNANASANDLLHDSAKQAGDAVNAEFDDAKKHSKDLYSELSKIVDQNGKIKEGYEDRASTITGELSEALGIEIEIVDGQVEGYKELANQIEIVMEKKRAEALLTAYQDEYTTAVQNQRQAYNDLQEAQQLYAEKQQALINLQGLMSGYTETANGAIEYQGQLYGSVNELLYDKTNGLIQNTYEAAMAEQQMEIDTQAASDALRTAEGTYYSNQAVISNYGKTLDAVAKGDVNGMKVAVEDLSNGFLTAEVGNQASLTRQVADVKTEYENMLTEWRSGNDAITAADLASKYAQYQKAQAELEKYKQMTTREGKDAGRGNVDAYTAEVEAGSKRAEVAANNVAKTATDKMAQIGSRGASSAAQATTSKYSSGISSGATSVNAAASALASGASGKLNASGSAYSNGVNTAQGFANGISAGAYSVYNAAVALAAQADLGIRTRMDEHSPSKVTEKLGRFGTEGFVNGLLKDKADVFSAAESVASASVSGMESVSMPRIGLGVSGTSNNFVSPASQQTNNNNVSITVYGAQGQDVNELADIISDKINASVDRRRAIFA